MLVKNGLADLVTASLLLSVGVTAAHAQPMQQPPLPSAAEIAMPHLKRDPIWVQDCIKRGTLEPDHCREIERDSGWRRRTYEARRQQRQIS